MNGRTSLVDKWLVVAIVQLWLGRVGSTIRKRNRRFKIVFNNIKKYVTYDPELKKVQIWFCLLAFFSLLESGELSRISFLSFLSCYCYRFSKMNNTLCTLFKLPAKRY